MNINETKAILGILRTAYPRFYANITKPEAEATVALWNEMFKDNDAQTVTLAVKSLIATFEYPPTIANIKEYIYKNGTESKDLTEYWDEAYKMICNGLYMTEEQFNEASPIVKKFFGNVRQVKELALCDIDTVNTVTKGQFLKQAEIISKGEKERGMLPNDLKQLISEKILSIEGGEKNCLKELK